VVVLLLILITAASVLFDVWSVRAYRSYQVAPVVLARAIPYASEFGLINLVAALATVVFLVLGILRFVSASWQHVTNRVVRTHRIGVRVIIAVAVLGIVIHWAVGQLLLGRTIFLMSR
jgi:hypothetical protein